MSFIYYLKVNVKSFKENKEIKIQRNKNVQEK